MPVPDRDGLHVQPLIEFVGEQDGPVEQDLKSRFAPVLLSFGVQRAYLAQVRFANEGPHSVAVCIVGAENPQLVHELSAVFKSIFNSNQFLDILFVQSPVQESQLAAACRPFFVAA